MQPTGPMMDPGFGWLVWLLIYAVLVIVPAWKVLTRVGFSGWWSLLMVITPLNLLLLWVFAFIDWPRLPKRAGERP